MGETTTWFSYLDRFPGWRHLESVLGHHLARPSTAMFPSYFTLTHVLLALVVTAFAIYGSIRFYMGVRRGGDSAIIPPANLGLRNIFEMITDATLSTMVSVMGEKQAKKHLPFIGALALFILFANFLALVPGFAPATATLKTNLTLALIVFLATHYYGIKEHGASYIKQFLGPLPVVAPFIFVIEIISHIARPVSLSVRLLGNMLADHKVILAFTMLIPILVPVPFLLLGVLVAIIQALVFCMLSMVYISMAVSHGH